VIHRARNSFEGADTLAERFDPRVDQETDVGDGKVGDVADFTVAEVILEFQTDDFLLIGG